MLTFLNECKLVEPPQTVSSLGRGVVAAPGRRAYLALRRISVPPFVRSRTHTDTPGSCDDMLDQLDELDAAYAAAVKGSFATHDSQRIPESRNRTFSGARTNTV
jgi:hypothetical protein